MRIRGVGRLQQAGRWIGSRFVNRALILLYHSVTEMSSSLRLERVTPQHFSEHLKILREDFRPMGLQQLDQALQDGDLPRRAVVVTFDDGYDDNLYNAKPLLERADVPATVFVTTGYVDRGSEFWWDELEGLLLQPGTLPETLQLSVSGRTWKWDLSGSPHPRQHLFRSLHRLLSPLPDNGRQKVLEELLVWTGSGVVGPATHRALSPDEVSRLAEGGLVEIGAHTVTHPILSALPTVAQRSEIEGSKARLEEILGRPVTSFAYPYGSRSDYTTESVAIVRETGFARACSDITDVVRRGSDCFQLPRLTVRDWDGETFARRLRRWIGI